MTVSQQLYWCPSQEMLDALIVVLQTVITDETKYHIDAAELNEIDYPVPTWVLLVTFYEWHDSGLSFANSGIEPYLFDPYYMPPPDANSVAYRPPVV